MTWRWRKTSSEDGNDDGAGKRDPELVRQRQPRDADEPRAPSDPRRARGHRAPRDPAGGSGVRARTGTVLRDEPASVRPALPLRARDRGGGQRLRPAPRASRGAGAAGSGAGGGGSAGREARTAARGGGA